MKTNQNHRNEYLLLCRVFMGSDCGKRFDRDAVAFRKPSNHRTPRRTQSSSLRFLGSHLSTLLLKQPRQQPRPRPLRSMRRRFLRFLLLRIPLFLRGADWPIIGRDRVPPKPVVALESKPQSVRIPGRGLRVAGTSCLECRLRRLSHFGTHPA